VWVQVGALGLLDIALGGAPHPRFTLPARAAAR
jgi:hypothetical protein